MIDTREKFPDAFEINDNELRFSLEERQGIIKRFNDEMSSVIALLRNYTSELKYMVDNKLDVSAITHLTFGADSHLLNIFPLMYDYHECVVKYLLDDNYQKNHDYWNELKNIADELLKHMNRVKDQRLYYEHYEPAYDFFEHRITKEGLSDFPDCYSELLQEINYSRYTGMDLMNVLFVALCHIKDLMADIKDNSNSYDSDTLSIIYDLNYKLYVSTYWPEMRDGFRKHIARQIHDDDDLEDYLYEQLRREILNFEGNPLGSLWRNFEHDKSRLALKLKNKSLSDDNWNNYFGAIKRFEEYEKWIEELRNPQFQQKGESGSISSEIDCSNDVSEKIIAFFSDGTLKVDEPSLLYFLMLAMWARRLLPNKEIPAFVRKVGDAYPSLFDAERTQDRIIMSLQNMNTKANKYFDDFVKDQATMIDYIDLMYPKTKKGKRRKECKRAINLATELFLKLK